MFPPAIHAGCGCIAATKASGRAPEAAGGFRLDRYPALKNKLEIMPEKTMNRWITVVGAILIQLALGAIYAWSLFTKPLTDAEGIYKWTASQAAWVFSIGLLTFAVVMVLAGRWQAKIGPRPVAILGGIVLGAGYILAGFLGNSFVAQLLLIGVMGGAGIGLAYVVPIAVLVKWFPDMKGLITGLAVAGFGFGATIWVKAGGAWFHLVENLSLFGLSPVQSTYVLYGGIFFVMVFLGGLVMINPPEGYKPEGWEPPAPTETTKATGAEDFDSGEMLKTGQFWAIWLTFVFSALAGLMVIYCIKLFGIDALKFGAALIAMCLIQGVAMLAFYYIGDSKIGLIVGASIIGFNFGGNFALFPAVTADFFGNKKVGLNYGWVFLAYGIAGVAGPQIAGYFKDAAKGATDASAWQTPFFIAAGACILGGVIMMLVKPPKKTA